MYNKIWYVSKYGTHPNFGIPTRQYFYSKYFSRKRSKVTLISSRSDLMHNTPNLGLKNHISFKDEELNCVILNGPKIKRGFNLKRIWSWLVFEFRFLVWAIFFRKNKPDVIIVSSLSILTFFTGSILKKYFKCKLVCEVRDIHPLTIVETKGWTTKNIFGKILAFIEQMGYKNADVIVGSMPNLIEHVNNINPEFSNKVYHVPMGYDPYFYKENNSDDNDIFKEIFKQKVPEQHFTAGYAGTIGFVNCVDHIIAAALELKDQPITFLILGDGSMKESLIQEIKDKGLLNVIFLDSVKKKYVQHFLKKCDILLHPVEKLNIYRYGVSPNKWIDYMYSSRPIIVSYDGFRSVINDADCGRFIEANNASVLARTILELSKMSDQELHEMGERGKRYLEENLNYDFLSDYYLRVIDENSI